MSTVRLYPDQAAWLARHPHPSLVIATALRRWARDGHKNAGARENAQTVPYSVRRVPGVSDAELRLALDYHRSVADAGLDRQIELAREQVRREWALFRARITVKNGQEYVEEKA